LQKGEFKLEKLKNPLLVRNVDGTVNMGGAIIYQVEYNMFFKRHIERMRMDVYNLGKIKVILEMLWLAAYNPEIDWKKGEVEMIKCPLICKRKKQGKKRKEVRRTEKEKVVEELVPKRFWKWKKVFRKAESERMPVQKTWNYAIELKKGFIPKKWKMYSLSRKVQEEVQAFVEDQL